METIDQKEAILNHQKKLYNFCLKLTKDRYKAEDLFQDTWVKALEKRDQYNEDFPYEPWLMSLCINLYRDFYRRNKLTGKLFQLFSRTEVMDATIASFRDPQSTAEEQVLEEEQNELLRKVLDCLDDKYRLPLILYYYNGYSYAQIAKVLSIKEGTVKSRIFTAKSKLKERMVSYER